MLCLVLRQNLKNLNPADMNTATRECCLPGTRLDILDFITDWVTNPSLTQNVFWLYGLAGAGKSTLATTVANRFRELRRLGAFLTFDRNILTRSDPDVVIRTIAYYIGLFDSRLGAVISVAVQNEPGICQAPLDTQFTKLLLDPIKSTEVLLNEGPIIIVIDALDECGTAKSRKALLTVLVDQLPRLPSFIRLLITSRAVHDIRKAFNNHVNVCCRELDITSIVNENDIHAYIGHEMVSIREENEELDMPQDWPGEDIVRALVQRSGGLFIWASTAVAFIHDGHDPNDRLRILLQQEVRVQAESALDDLYITALRSAGKWDDETFCSDFRTILGTILTAFVPLSLESVDHLAGLKGKRPASHTISHFRCVLRWSDDGPVQIIHPSFSDFLLDRSRCQSPAWFIDGRLHRRSMTNRCLDTLVHTLEQPPVGPDSHYWVHGDHPKHLSYAARWWSEHLLQVDEANSEVVDHLDMFLSGRLLPWFNNEVMTSEILKRMKTWIDVSPFCHIKVSTIHVPPFSTEIRTYITLQRRNYGNP